MPNCTLVRASILDGQGLDQAQAVHRFGVAVVRQVRAGQLRLAGFVEFQGRSLDGGLSSDQARFKGCQ